MFVSHYIVIILNIPHDETALASVIENLSQFIAHGKLHILYFKDGGSISL